MIRNTYKFPGTILTILWIITSVGITRAETAADAISCAQSHDRKPLAVYYESGSIPLHVGKPEWLSQFKFAPLLHQIDLGNDKLIVLGQVITPTIGGTGNGLESRYRGIHRGVDIGIDIKRLKGRIIPVYAVADGVYDGQRSVHTTDAAGFKEAQPMVFYHLSPVDSNRVITSILCHVDPLISLKVGSKVQCGEQVGTLEDPVGAWSAHVHVELYARPVYSSKGTTKRSIYRLHSDQASDASTKLIGTITGGCGLFEDDLYLLNPKLNQSEK